MEFQHRHASSERLFSSPVGDRIVIDFTGLFERAREVIGRWSIGDAEIESSLSDFIDRETLFVLLDEPASFEVYIDTLASVMKDAMHSRNARAFAQFPFTLLPSPAELGYPEDDDEVPEMVYEAMEDYRDNGGASFLAVYDGRWGEPNERASVFLALVCCCALFLASTPETDIPRDMF